MLDPQYRALVVALSARMHALVSVSENSNGKFTVDVESPQFTEGRWCYEDGVEVNGRRNPFVESTIDIVTTYARQMTSKTMVDQTIKVTMYSDAEYHSRVGGNARKSANGSREFLFHENEITKVNKTGLGSSAGLVTSLTAALLSVLIPGFELDSTKWKEIVHNLAQISHCKAQGKIGSGFDVASATFGSIFYQRFDPKLITDVLAIKDAGDFAVELVKLVNETNWEMVYEPCRVPKGFTLMMGDVQGGSETPKMVSKVNEWRSRDPERALKVWEGLNKNNMKVINGFKELERISQLDPKRYELILAYTSTHKAADYKNSEFPEISSIVSAIDEIRELFKLVTRESGADIEPDEQSVLLDACCDIKGVVGGVVPGAGGYDAICLIVNQEQVPTVKGSQKGELSKVRWMDIREESYGLIEESPDGFIGL